MIDLEKIPEAERNDLAFQMVVALRDTVNIAKKKGEKSTYENAIQLFHDFSPELYEQIVTCLPQRNISEEARVYIAAAQVRTQTEGVSITPLEILDAEIHQYKELSQQIESDSSEQKRVIRNKIASLEKLRKSLKPRSLTEHRILARDISRADRSDFGAQFIEETDFFVDYNLSDKKYLRIRLLHPDAAEHVTGADLIYEQHNERNGKIRILFVQYKIWNDGILYFSQTKNFSKQLAKLDGCICRNKICDQPASGDGYHEYRFPYCSAFFRPTDKLQHQNEKLVSSGIHIPICTIKRFIENGNEKLERKKVRFQTLNHEIFEQLFNRGFIGSRWMDTGEVENFYKDHKILQNDDSILFYAREIQEDEYKEVGEELGR